MDKREAYRRQSRAASATDVYDESQPPLPPEEDGPDYATEEEKDETAKRCLRAFNITGMIFSVAICTAALYATTLAVGPSAQSLAYAVAGANIVLVFVTAVGFCAACSTLRLSLLLGFLASVAILTFGFFALSGFCFILTESLVRYAIANYDVLSVSFPPALRANLTLDRIISGMRGFFYSFGALSFIEALMCIGACSSAIRLVTPLKAYTLLLQASNLAVLPVGVVLIAIGAQRSLFVCLGVSVRTYVCLQAHI